MATFPLNAWYAAAYDVEVQRALLSRTVCNQALVLYRLADGRVAVLEDACWHRLLPLSMGRLEGDELVCGYHGIVYNPEGLCTHMPSQETINPSACVRAYPVLEKHRFVWVWPGDPAQADPALVPDLHWNDDPDWTGDGKTHHREVRLPAGDRQPDGPDARDLRARHVRSAAARSPRPRSIATHGDRSATVTRWMEGITAPPFWAGQIRHARGYSGPVDRWQIIRFEGAVHGGDRRRRGRGRQRRAAR